MSQVNFVQQINLFMEYARRNRLTSYDRIFWLGLFYCANRLAMGAENHEWPDDFFQVSNSELDDWAGLEERAIRNSRNRLKQMGLIDFQKGDGKRHDPFYKINYLSVTGYKIVPGNVGDAPPIGSKFDADGAGGSVGGCVGDGVGDAVRGHVGDAPPIGSKFAADGAGDPLYPYSNPNVYINTNRGTAKADAKTGTNAGRTERAQACAGLVDLGGTFTGTEGLVPLPWDDPGVRR